jgi:hypothetical protein
LGKESTPNRVKIGFRGVQESSNQQQVRLTAWAHNPKVSDPSPTRSPIILRFEQGRAKNRFEFSTIRSAIVSSASFECQQYRHTPANVVKKAVEGFETGELGEHIRAAAFAIGVRKV